jgi:hypothetical protein
VGWVGGAAQALRGGGGGRPQALRACSWRAPAGDESRRHFASCEARQWAVLAPSSPRCRLPLTPPIHPHRTLPSSTPSPLQYEGRHLRVDRGAPSTRPGGAGAGAQRAKHADVQYDPDRSLFLGNLDLQIEVGWSGGCAFVCVGVCGGCGWLGHRATCLGLPGYAAGPACAVACVCACLHLCLPGTHGGPPPWDPWRPS